MVRKTAARQTTKVPIKKGSQVIIKKDKLNGKHLNAQRKFKVLHVGGSNASTFYSKLSLLYGIPSFVNGPTEMWEHHFASVSKDSKTNQNVWQFLARDKLKNVENVQQQIEATKSLTNAKAMAHIVDNIGADVCVPHMFCYPGFTTFRSVFDLLDIPYLGTAAEMQGVLEDKWMSRGIAINDGCRLPEGQMLKANDISQVNIKCPVIVKPAREDNSNGVSHVKKQKDLQAALEEAFKWDSRVLIEQFIPGREIRVAIVPKKIIQNIDIDIRQISKGGAKKSVSKIQEDDEELVVLPFLEYLFPPGVEIRTLNQKLVVGKDGTPDAQNKGAFKASKLPAEVSDELAEELGNQAKLAFKSFDCRHYCVFDFRVMTDPKTKKEIPYLLEACPSAGFSPASIIVRMADVSSQMGGPDLQHPRLFKGVLNTCIKESLKFKLENGLKDKGMSTLGMKK